MGPSAHPTQWRVRLDTRRGSVLVLSYIFVTLIGMWVAIGLQRSTVELRAAERYVQTMQAFHLADGGLDDAHQWMRGRGSPPAGTGRFDPWGGPQPMGRGRFRVEIDPDDNNPTRYNDVFNIEATGEVNGIAVTRRVAKVLVVDSFARYAYFTDSERLPPNTRIWFTSRDYLNGPVHSNDQFNISGSPVFDAAVSSAASSVNYQNPPPAGGNNPQFNGGLSLNATPVTLPLSVTQLRVAASSTSGAWFTGNTTIALLANGTMLVTNPVLRWVNQPQLLPANGAIFVNGGNVTVSGTLNGQLSIGTNRDLIIANDVRYADDPRLNVQSDDVLGLVAEQNVVVSQQAPTDLTIQASVMALNSSFAVENWWQGSPKGTLHVYGGIIQKSRGPVGTFSRQTGAKLSGYSKDYQYDTRFSDLAPPFYPTTSAYREVLWQDND